MKEHPILFSGEMVRAILDGRKTQTRRIVKIKDGDYFDTRKIYVNQDILNQYAFFSSEQHDYYCPYGKVGDRLWVREKSHLYPAPHISGWVYTADGVFGSGGWGYSRHVRPSIHMPRIACRIILEITDIRVERLQDIDGDDILSEGVKRPPEGYSNALFAGVLQGRFEHLWDSINGKKHPWESNPWVWAISFKKL